MQYASKPNARAEQLIEALHTQPMNCFQVAQCLEELHQVHGLSRGELARLMGRTLPEITEKLALNGLPVTLQNLLLRAQAPEAIARVLLRLPDEVSRLRVARRILGEQLCVRDALLIAEADCRRLKRESPAQGKTPPEERTPRLTGRVIHLTRDHRPYVNAIRAIAGQMKDAGLPATLMEECLGRCLTVTLSVPLRRRRMERYQHIS